MHKTLLTLLLASMFSGPLFAQVSQQQAQPQLTEEQRLQRQAQARARRQAQQAQAQQAQLTEEQRLQRQAQARARQQVQQQQEQPQPQQAEVQVREQQAQARQTTKTQKKQTQKKTTQTKKPQTQARQRRTGLNHRWSISIAFLEQNGPFREFALLADNLWYAVQFPVWGLSNASFGFSLGGAYDYTFTNRLMIRFQYGLETAGWITGFFDLGMGVRVPLKTNLNLTMEGYFSIVYTGATLGIISTPVPGNPNEFSAHLGIFGFKGRMSLEVALKKNYFIAPYISYAVYPWVVSSLQNMSINGFSQGYLIDALNIGIEFGRKF